MKSSSDSKQVVILFDLGSSPPEDHNYSTFLKDPDWASEKAVASALKNAGYEPVYLGVHDDLLRLVRELKEIKPSAVFNLTEAFRNSRTFESQVAGILDLLDIPYTGTKSLGLGICHDKALTKKILGYHGIRVPASVTFPYDRPFKSLRNLRFPAFVKLAKEEASEGISRDSFVETEEDALVRIRFLHSRYEADVLVEEFIPGRKFYVSLLGSERLEVLPVRELCYREFPEDKPRFATYKSKWDEAYRKRWGIRSEFAKKLGEDERVELEKIAKEAFRALYLTGYARLDMRLAEDGEVVVLEANPNPSLAVDDDFALSAAKIGYSFPEVVEKILGIASRSHS